MARLVVFLDWQNVYKRARETFENQSDPSAKGQTDPVDLAHVLLRKAQDKHPDMGLELEQIRIYRGRPRQQQDPQGYNAFQRQAAKWAQNNKIIPNYRDLNYPDDWGEESCVEKPREKGVDVAIAVDLVTMAHDNLFDLAIVMSADYDLVPALEHVFVRRLTRGDGPAVAVAAWKGDLVDKPLRVRLPHHNIWCFWLDRQDYWGVQDERDYNAADPGRRAISDGRPRPAPPTRRY